MTEWLTGIVGERLAPMAGFILLFLAVILALFFLFWILRRLAGGTFVAGGRNRVARLSVMDAAAVDNRRRLVLIRRDDVEHLVLIGGPTDVVVETNIRQTAKVTPRIQPIADVTAEEEAATEERPAPIPPTPPIAAPSRTAAAPPQPPRPVEPPPASPYQAAPRPPLRTPAPPMREPGPVPSVPTPEAPRVSQTAIAGGAALAGAAAAVASSAATSSTGIPAPNFTATPPVSREPEPEFDLTSEVTIDLGDVRASRDNGNGDAPHISLSEPDFSFDDEINLEEELHGTLSGELNIAPDAASEPEPTKPESGPDKLEDEMERLLSELSHPSKQ